MPPSQAARLAMLLLIGLTGCQPVWVKADEGEHEFALTANECMTVTRGGYFGYGLVGEMNRRAYLDRCITAHGYRQIDPHNMPDNVKGHGVVAPLGAYLDPTSDS